MVISNTALRNLENNLDLLYKKNLWHGHSGQERQQTFNGVFDETNTTMKELLVSFGLNKSLPADRNSWHETCSTLIGLLSSYESETDCVLHNYRLICFHYAHISSE